MDFLTADWLRANDYLLQILIVFLAVVLLITNIVVYQIGRRKKKKIFFVSPVQTATPKNTAACEEYIAKLEKQGDVVFWPIRDNPHQKTDPTGIAICDRNLKEILRVDEIHVWYLKESSGIHFDIGATYMLIRIFGRKKKIVFANRNEFNQELSQNWGKSFVKILDFLEKNT